MPSLREERLQEQVSEIRPQLSKAREIAEKADAEGRPMSAEEQKTFDEIMKKGREVSDAVKAIATIRRCSPSRGNSPTRSPMRGSSITTIRRSSGSRGNSPTTSSAAWTAVTWIDRPL